MEKITLKWSNSSQNWHLDKKLEYVPKFGLIFLILAANYLTFNLNGNEEQYMLFAKQFMNPEWIHSKALNEFPGTRILYQIIIGFFLKYFSFENVLFFSRVVLCALFARPIAKIYKELNINNVQILLHLPLLFLLNQSLFADSWMLISVEPKGLSYVFIIYALYYFMKANLVRMLVFLLVAAYFHILVGGYGFIYLMGTILLFEKKKEKIKALKLAVVFLLALLPYIFYLKTAVSNKVVYTPSVDWIYTYFRSPHHTALFRDLGYFYSKHFYGVVLSGMALLFSRYLTGILTDNKLKRLNNFLFTSLVGVLIFVIIAFFDKQGVILKYYPFRINTVSTFVLTLLISLTIFLIVKSQYRGLLGQFIILLAAMSLLKVAVANGLDIYKHLVGDKNKPLETMTEYIRKETDKQAVILSFYEDQSLIRKMERERFVVYKFIPAEMNKIPDWYERLKYKRKLQANLNLLKNSKREYKIDYILTSTKKDLEVLDLTFSSGPYYLYKLKEGD